MLIGNPFTDAPELGSQSLVVTDNNPQAARRLAMELADAFWADHEKMFAELVPLSDAIADAPHQGGPVTFTDAADAPSSGASGAGQDCCARSRILVSARRTTSSWAASRRRSARCGSRIPPATAADGSDGLGRAARRRPALHRRRHGRLHRSRARRPRLAWPPPTVVESRSTDEPVWREEVFGPVVAVMPFDDEDEAVALANDTEYGLSGSIYTRDLGRALRVARGVEAGNLSVNSHASVRYWTPFGGYKQSGLGREPGSDAPAAFTEEKNVFIATDRDEE